MSSTASATPPVALTIAGSDSGGGAGIQADLRTFAAHGVFGTSAITAVTAQNTVEVRAVEVLPATLVRTQVVTVLDDLPVAAVKTGMLATAEVVATVAAMATAGLLPNLVVDPVMVASSGARLLSPEAEETYRRELLPHALVVTPNLHEAGVLLRREITTLEQQRTAAQQLTDLGPRVVVVKGGHAVRGSGGQAVDVVAHRGARELRELTAPRIAGHNTHGSGCTFAAAVAAGLAHGRSVDAAIDAAKSYVHTAIRSAAGWQLGAGHGPLDHLRWEHTR